MLVRLRAEERLSGVNIVALGNGVMKKEQQRETLRQWRKDAEKDDGKKHSRKATAHELRRIGIGIRVPQRDENE